MTTAAASADRVAAFTAQYRQAAQEKRLRGIGIGLVVALLVVLAGIGAEVDPAKFAANLWRFPNYFVETIPTLRLATFWADLGEWYWGFGVWTSLLAQTLLMAYVGTLLGAVFAFFLSFLAAANLGRNPWVRAATRRFLEFTRTVPEIVFALIFVIAFGLGPIPGVLAIAIHTVGALGKLFSEVAENIDMKPVDGIYAAGGSWWQMVRYAVVPQVVSNYASYALLRFEINVRGASVMGFVGAGGIGQDLIEAIRKFYFSDVSAILLLIIATVVIIDLVTERVRHMFIDMEHRR